MRVETVELSSTDGPLRADVTVWPTSFVVDVTERPESWTYRNARGAVRCAILDGRIRIEGLGVDP